MIVAQMSEVTRQKSVLPAVIVRAIEALQKVDLNTQPVGRYELEGSKLFYMIQEIELRSFDESRTEVHHKFADVQIPLSTTERFGFSPPQPGLVASEDRLEANDVAFYPTPASESFVDIDPGSFVVFLPRELHRPCLIAKEKGRIRKAVIKVHASLLGL
jgi:biofilm protein TabA